LTFVEACDFVVATPDAVFGSPAMTAVETNDAEIPTLVRSVGLRRAKQSLWLDERISASEAVELGLVNWVVGIGSIDQYIEAVIQRLGRISRETLELSKEAFRFLEARQGWDDFNAYHFISHQLSHHTSAASTHYEARLKQLAQSTDT
jgi:enoyl-CoA hydratase